MELHSELGRRSESEADLRTASINRDSMGDSAPVAAVDQNKETLIALAVIENRLRDLALPGEAINKLADQGYIQILDRDVAAMLFKVVASSEKLMRARLECYAADAEIRDQQAQINEFKKSTFYKWFAGQSIQNLVDGAYDQNNLAQRLVGLLAGSTNQLEDLIGAAEKVFGRYTLVGESYVCLTPRGRAHLETLIRERFGSPKDPSSTGPVIISAFARTWVWEFENQFSSKGKLKEIELVGVPLGSDLLKNDRLHVTGLETFKQGTKPGDSHTTETENPDSFDQAMLFHALQQAREQYDVLSMGMNYGELLALRRGRTHLRAFANSFSDTNAYYSPNTGELHFGTSDGKWDLASDQNVAGHEQGHNDKDALIPNCFWGIGGALHEAFGDAKTAFNTRDAEISEDFGKVRGGEGQALRTVANDATVSNTSSEVHDRGNVYSGFAWDLGVYLHKHFTGSTWSKGELLDERAASLGLKILYTYPLFVGTTSPKNTDYLRSIDRALTTLAEGGHLPKELDLKAFRAEIDKCGRMRELRRLDVEQGNGEPVSLTAKSSDEALREAVSSLGSCELQYQQLSETAIAPDGTKITRYQILRPVQVDGKRSLAPIEDDYLTILESPQGQFEAQFGQLQNLCQGLSGGTPGFACVALGGSSAPVLDWNKVEQAFGEMHKVAEANLKEVSINGFQNPSWLDGHLHHKLLTIADGVEAEGIYSSSAKFAREALDTLSAGQERIALVWKRGALMVRLDADEMTYYAPIDPSGKIGNPIRTCLVV